MWYTRELGVMMKRVTMTRPAPLRLSASEGVMHKINLLVGTGSNRDTSAHRRVGPGLWYGRKVKIGKKKKKKKRSPGFSFKCDSRAMCGQAG